MKSQMKITKIIVLLFLFLFCSCAKEGNDDYSSVRVKINGKECRMFPGYNCEPINRTFIGHEYLDNVLLRFHSLYMAENYLATDREANDTIYVINMMVLANKFSFKPFVGFYFNDAEADSEGLNSLFEIGSPIESPVLSGRLIARAPHQHKEWSYTISSGTIVFGDMIKKSHRLYDGSRWVWKCREAFFEFDAKSEDGEIIHITDGHCKL